MDANQLQNIPLAIGVVIAAAYLVAEVSARVAQAVLRRILSDDLAAFRSPIVRRPLRLVRAAIFVLVAISGVPPALELAGVRLGYGLEAETVSQWLVRSGGRIALITLLAYILMRLVTTVVQRFEQGVTSSAGLDVLERAKRAKTLGALIRSVVFVLVSGIAVLMILGELDINIMPVLTGAGIVGLAIGFGAQTLVKDVLSGFFLILENQVRVGDVAVINGTSGLVEAINLRTIVLRDLEGTVHVFPNGSIERLANKTRDFSYAVVDVGVAYKEDVDRVVATLRDVGADLLADPQYRPNILESLEIMGIDNLGDWQVTIKIRIKTVPLKQWEVGRELRRRIKKAFDARGIEIPFPHRTIYYRTEPAATAPGPAAPR